MAKLIKDDAETIYIGREDGSLLQVGRHAIDFLPEEGQDVQVFQKGEDYIVVPTEKLTAGSQEQLSRLSTSRRIAGVLAMIFGGIGLHSLYLKRKYAWIRVVLSLLPWLIIFKDSIRLDHFTAEEGIPFLLSFFIVSILGIWGICDSLSIWFSEAYWTKWVKDR